MPITACQARCGAGRRGRPIARSAICCSASHARATRARRICSNCSIHRQSPRERSSTKAPQFPNSPIVDGLSATAGRVPWRANFLGTFTQGGFSATVSERFVSAGKYDATYVEGIDINDNTTPSRFYTDLTLEQKIPGDANFTVYVQATNLFNRRPPLVPIQTTLQQYTYAALYDVIGRYMTAGVRVKF
ncbi:MAG: TonB-dependent receptor [Sphingomonas sp.]|nr:MAG: TonB-dependent receptor [Sphingomonas sp.]